jgi:response regulator NasT
MTRVLIIDDDSPARAGLARHLSACGYEVAGESSSIGSAAQLAQTKAPEVLLMTADLPEIDPGEAAQIVMNGKPVALVMMSQRHDATTIARARSAGASGYLVKPFRAEEVRPAIEIAISCFQALAKLREEISTLKQTLQQRKIIERAKGLLMEQRKLSEEQAYTLLKKASMRGRKPMADIAEAILMAGGLLSPKEK